jgi:hypothetical protein
MARKKKEVLKDWTVTMRCVVIKEVYCPQCTEEDARNTPWDMAQDETETSQEDWQVVSVKENA